MSDTNLLSALLAFQKNAPTLSRDSENPHYHNRYVSLDSIMQKVTPLLAEHGLIWVALPCIENGDPALRYRLLHAESGEVLEGVMPLMLAKADSQGQGSALTYARRYAISAVLGLSAEDDDGNKASGGGRQQASAPATPQRVRAELSQAKVAEVLAAISRARMPGEWYRLQLIEAGVQNVPEGQIMQSTIKALTPAQAESVISACNDVTEARERATA